MPINSADHEAANCKQTNQPGSLVCENHFRPILRSRSGRPSTYLRKLGRISGCLDSLPNSKPMNAKSIPANQPSKPKFSKQNSPASSVGEFGPSRRPRLILAESGEARTPAEKRTKMKAKYQADLRLKFFSRKRKHQKNLSTHQLCLFENLKSKPFWVDSSAWETPPRLKPNRIISAFRILLKTAPFGRLGRICFCLRSRSGRPSTYLRKLNWAEYWDAWTACRKVKPMKANQFRRPNEAAEF
jgi:hypothetical protein